MKRDRIKVIVWTAAIASMLLISIVLYPQMETQVNEMSDMFANMGGFTAAFNMDKVNFGEYSGYFAVECGNVLGLGGAFFAACSASPHCPERNANARRSFCSHIRSHAPMSLHKSLQPYWSKC